jgi:spore coat polysaccharide biosynthesis protein SpsF
VTTAILQARMSSTRLKGKVLLDIEGRPMILRQIERIRRAKTISKIVLATSSDSTDDPLEEFANSEQIDVYRGSLEDVFSRFREICKLSTEQNFVRLTGDCPLTDPSVIDKVVIEHLHSGADYTSNTVKRTYPRGLDVEVFRSSALNKLGECGLSKQELEHVTLGFHSRADQFSLHSVSDPMDNSGLRWTVDTKEDFEFVAWVYSSLLYLDPYFDSSSIYSLLAKHPERILEDT